MGDNNSTREGLKERKEPFGNVLGIGSPGSPAFRSFCPMFIVGAVKQHVLSFQALQGVSVLLQDEDPWGEERDDYLQDGAQVTLRELSLRLLPQSYKLSEKYDKPEGCLCVLQVLVAAVEKPSSRIKALEILSSLISADVAACTRFLLVSPQTAAAHFINVDIPKPLFLRHALADFKTFVQRKNHACSKTYVTFFLANGLVFDFQTDTSFVKDCLELVYLIVTYIMSTFDFEIIPRLLDGLISPILDASAGRDELKMSRRRLELSVAGAYEALGDLPKAVQIYEDSEQLDDSARLASMIDESTPFWALKSTHKIDAIHGKSSKIMGAREIEGSGIAIFLKSGDLNKKENRTSFLVSRKDGTTALQRLPHDGKFWGDVKVVPTPSTEPLLLLVAPQKESDDFMTLSLLPMMGRSDGEEPVPVQLWEFDGDASWSELPTRGDVPSRVSLTATGSHCMCINQKIVLFGGMTLSFPTAGEKEKSPVYILSLETKEWQRVPHPYQTSFSADQQRPPSGPMFSKLPSFSTMATCNLGGGGEQVIMLFRKGTSLLNKKRNNELVPKFAVDLFAQDRFMSGDATVTADSSVGLFHWMLDVPTTDRIGYIADHTGAKCVQITGSALLVLGENNYDMIQRLKSPDGQGTKIELDHGPRSRAATTDLLDLETMEWRGLSIHNQWLLGSDIQSSSELLVSRSGDDCHFIVLDQENKLRFLCLHNASRIQSSNCIQKVVSTKKLKSKKNALRTRLRRPSERNVTLDTIMK